MGVEPASVSASVRPCVRGLTHSNMNISAHRGSIASKFYLKHYLVGGKAISRTSSNFGQIRRRTAELAALERLKKSHRL